MEQSEIKEKIEELKKKVEDLRKEAEQTIQQITMNANFLVGKVMGQIELLESMLDESQNADK